MNEERPLWRSASVLSALGALVALVATDTVLRHAGGKASDLTLFIGRFHPLAVHLPIGIILLVGAAEAATLAPRLRPRLDPAIALALPVLVAAAAGSFVLGHLLARSGDFAPGALNVHRRFELFAVVGVCLFPLAWAYQERAATPAARWAYRSLLGVTLGVLSLGAHFGGTLTRGDTYLSRYAPGPLKALLGGPTAAAPAAPASAKAKAQDPRLFADVIQPLLTERCVSCHGSEKVKGGLRLDSLVALTKGGEDGVVVTPGNPSDSPLLQRLLLPADDDDHMPPEGKPALTAPEIALLRFWIERGANDTLLVRDLLAPTDARTVLEHALSGPAAPAAPTAPPAPPSSGAPPTHDAKTPTFVAPPAAATAPRAAPVSPSNPSEATPRSSPPPPSAPEATGPSTAASVLADKCEKCHGAAKQKAKLRVDSLEALLAGGKSGPAVVPGKPGASKLIERVNLPADDDKHMPPTKEPQLSPRELALLSSFIQSIHPGGRPSPGPQAPGATSSAPPSRTPASTSAATSAATPASTSTSPSAPAPSTAATPAFPPESPPPAPATALRSAPADPPPPELLASLPSHLALYPTEVAPLLRQRCATCHAGKSPAGGLAIGSYPALLKGGDTGPAVTPGKPDQSLIVQRLGVALDDSDHMPPEGAPQLTLNQIALVSAWIEKDGSADGEVALSALPAPAVRAIAEHPPARAAGDVAAATPRAHAGGCGACVVSSRAQAPYAAIAATGALLVALSLRRRRAAAC